MAFNVDGIFGPEQLAPLGKYGAQPSSSSLSRPAGVSGPGTQNDLKMARDTLVKTIMSSDQADRFNTLLDLVKGQVGEENAKFVDIMGNQLIGCLGLMEELCKIRKEMCEDARKPIGAILEAIRPQKHNGGTVTTREIKERLINMSTTFLDFERKFFDIIDEALDGTDYDQFEKLTRDAQDKMLPRFKTLYRQLETETRGIVKEGGGTPANIFQVFGALRKAGRKNITAALILILTLAMPLLPEAVSTISSYLPGFASIPSLSAFKLIQLTGAVTTTAGGMFGSTRGGRSLLEVLQSAFIRPREEGRKAMEVIRSAPRRTLGCVTGACSRRRALTDKPSGDEHRLMRGQDSVDRYVSNVSRVIWFAILAELFGLGTWASAHVGGSLGFLMNTYFMIIASFIMIIGIMFINMGIYRERVADPRKLSGTAVARGGGGDARTIIHTAVRNTSRAWPMRRMRNSRLKRYTRKHSQSVKRKQSVNRKQSVKRKTKQSVKARGRKNQ
jgi:hypothetical protein